MKYSILIAERRGAASIEDATRIVGGVGNLKFLRQAGWLKPKIQTNRLTLFDYEECLVAWKRITIEGYEALKTAAAENGKFKKNATC